MSQASQDLRRQIFDELTKVVDPEINVSIMELELVDNIDIAGSEVKIDHTLDQSILSSNIWIQDCTGRT